MRSIILGIFIGTVSLSANATNKAMAVKKVCEGQVYKFLLQNDCYSFHSVKSLGQYEANTKLFIDEKIVRFTQDGEAWVTQTTCGQSAGQNHVVLTQPVRYYGQITDCEIIDSLQTWIE